MSGTIGDLHVVFVQNLVQFSSMGKVLRKHVKKQPGDVGCDLTTERWIEPQNITPLPLLLSNPVGVGFVRQSVVKATFSNSLVVGRDWINEGLLCT